jgi:hypothetical protein
MLWYIAVAIGVAQMLAILLGVASLRAAGRADRWLESARTHAPRA